MIRYEMSADEQIEDIKKRLGKAEKDYSKTVLARALKRVAKNYKTVLSKETVATYQLKSGEIKKIITTKRSSDRNQVMYYIKAKSYSRLLPYYKVNKLEPQPKGGKRIKYKGKVLKSSTLKVIKNGFWIPGKKKSDNGDGNVSSRGIIMSRPSNLKTGPASRKPTKDWIAYSPSVAVATSRKQSNDKAQASSMELLKKRIDHEIDVVLRKWEKKGR